MTALEKLDARWQAGGRICVGLDSDFELLPEMFQGNGEYSGIRSFNTAIVHHTMNLVLAYKLNLADYIEHGPSGLHALIDTFTLIRREAPDVLTILDCKFGDALANKNAKYAKFAFEQCRADAMTAQVYAGGDAAEGFTHYTDKLTFFLCKTSNDGSGEFQDVEIKRGDVQFSFKDINRPLRLYEDVAISISALWNRNENCGLVVGATYPEQMKEIRSMAGDMPILSPGIGEQGGDFEATIRAGFIPKLGRLLTHEGSSLIFTPYNKHGQKHEDPMTFAKAARQKLLDRTAEYNSILELEAA